jgi:ABC-type transport system involved in multi-copper enzyme maturation permease subunit
MIWELACHRLRLLTRQKVFWLGAVVSVAIVLLSYLLAQISFVKPEKIFWDFSLGAAFLLQVFLALFLASFLFAEEREKRTLHWVLSLKVSRGDWIAGNFLGLGFALSLLHLLASFLIFGVGFFFPEKPDLLLAAQSLFLSLLESWVILSLALFVSFWVRSILALSFTAILVFFLHSQDSLRRILTDPVSGRFTDNRGLEILLYLTRLFPPLQWFDLRDLVGYKEALPLLSFVGLCATALVWTFVYGLLSKWKFERLDL